MRTVELTRAGVAGSIAVFIVAAICIRLGVWQLDRRDQRLSRNALMAERLEAEPVRLTGVPRDTVGLTFRAGALEGRYDNDRTLVLAGRSHAGTPGVHIYSPLRVSGGAVLVNRGWLPARDAATAELEPLRVDSAVRVEGVLMPFPDAPPAAPPAEGFRTTWFRLNEAAIRGQYPYEIGPLYLVRVPDSAGAPAIAGPGRPLPVGGPEINAGPHLSYAVQWFSFAAIFLVGWAGMVMRSRSGGRG